MKTRLDSSVQYRVTPDMTTICFSPSDLAVVEMTDAFRQPSLFYHLGVRESFSMANNIILYCDTNSESLQSLQVSRRYKQSPRCTVIKRLYFRSRRRTDGNVIWQQWHMNASVI